jgi:hypothetical protein
VPGFRRAATGLKELVWRKDARQFHRPAERTMSLRQWMTPPLSSDLTAPGDDTRLGLERMGPPSTVLNSLRLSSHGAAKRPGRVTFFCQGSNRG